MKGKQRKLLNIPLCIYWIMIGIGRTSCHNGSQATAGSKVVNDHSQNTTEIRLMPGVESSVGDITQLNTVEYKGISFITENTMHGSGVVH
ncbi:hypothetical protein BWD42_02690 [Sphingobacterium sp. CZ-UAM]|uniref:hypothetical protein n=1 Tax=unclassified Sphingobacterium TaxID=2609468 RepID=UPI0009859A58|nr:hypothetical protein [Sphingobacterium sp. CZ-UAM]OOG18885.1 hypothetical protein BWD42_02690 [Sphingobacterium sp. CZ-UAM]